MHRRGTCCGARRRRRPHRPASSPWWKSPLTGGLWNQKLITTLRV